MIDLQLTPLAGSSHRPVRSVDRQRTLHDLQFDNGDLVLSTLNDGVLQHLIMRLRFYRGEWLPIRGREFRTSRTFLSGVFERRRYAASSRRRPFDTGCGARRSCGPRTQSRPKNDECKPRGCYRYRRGACGAQSCVRVGGVDGVWCHGHGFARKTKEDIESDLRAAFIAEFWARPSIHRPQACSVKSSESWPPRCRASGRRRRAFTTRFRFCLRLVAHLTCSLPTSACCAEDRRLAFAALTVNLDRVSLCRWIASRCSG